MPLIEVVYENGVFRPLQPVDLAEGAEGAVILSDATVSSAARNHPQEPEQALTEGSNRVNDANSFRSADETPGERAYRLLMEIAALPHTSFDGRTDISVQHDSILYPKQGDMP